MTLEETRQLGIEFERRVQTMIPEKELLDKLDSDTIFSFLNQYQDKYIHEIYRSLDQIPSGTKLSAHVEAVLQAMLKSVTINVGDEGVIDETSSNLVDPNGIEIMDTGRSIIYPLPSTYYMYVRSVSSVTSTFSFKSAYNEGNNTKIRVVPNELVSQNDVWKLIETPHNTLRILRHPAAVLSEHRNVPVIEEVLPTKIRIASVERNHDITIDGMTIPTSLYGSMVFMLNTYDKSVDGKDYYELTYSGDPNTIFHYMVAKQDGDDVTSHSYSLISERTGKLEDIATELKRRDDTDVIYVWTTDHSDSNTIGVYRVRDNYKTTLKDRPTLTVIYDQYTTPVGVKVLYYAEPTYFDVMTSTKCELPMDVFEDIVSGAVDLYVLYVAGAEARKRQMDEARRLLAKQQEKEQNNN